MTDAAQSDPVALGWMVGSPPPAERIIRYGDGSYMAFPQLRWSLSHWRELLPTRRIARGDGAVAPLPPGPPADLDALTFTPIGGDRTMTWAESLAANYTDGILVLHHGHVVYEQYFGALAPDPTRQHIAFSVTKSFVGTLVLTLAAEGRIDVDAPVTRYVPELAGSAFGDAMVRHALEMTTAFDHSEDYADPNASFVDYARACGLYPVASGYGGPTNLYDYLKSLRKNGEHGVEFHYRSPNTDVLGWIVARVTGQPVDAVLRERVWSRLGAEGDACMALDRIGTPLAAGGLNLRLSDLARYGEMIRLGGRWHGEQVVPASVVEEIRRGGDRNAFKAGGHQTLPGWSYNVQWWVSHDDHGVFMARGIHGQAIYIDPKAGMVIVRFASHPKAGNRNLDPTSLPAYRAVADHLIARGR